MLSMRETVELKGTSFVRFEGIHHRVTQLAIRPPRTIPVFMRLST